MAILGLGVVGLVVVAIFSKPPEVPNPDLYQQEAGREISQEDKARAEGFLRTNISALSPEKEVLGGKFYVTNIAWETSSGGVISYEDGHIALRARFTILFSAGAPSVTSFIIVPSP